MFHESSVGVCSQCANYNLQDLQLLSLVLLLIDRQTVSFFEAYEEVVVS